MDLQDFLDKMNSGEEIEAGSDYHLFMGKLSQEALKITAEMNNQYRTPEELMELMRKLTGNDVWLGANVTVCPGVTIGDGAVIAAGAVVTGDIEPGTIAAGVPARKIKEIRREVF